MSKETETGATPQALRESPCSAEIEFAVRVMRDRVYGVPSTDKNWLACRDNWMRKDSVEWLRDQLKKQLNNQAEPLSPDGERSRH